MADTALASMKGSFIDITFAGNGADWSLADTSLPAEIRAMAKVKVDSITFVPSAAADVCVIKEGSDSGPIIMQTKNALTTSGVYTEHKVYFRGKWMSPYFDLSAGTLTTPSSCKILIELA